MMSEYDFLLKILIIGDPGTGKSCILGRFADDPFHEFYIPTIGVDFKIETVEIDSKKIKLQIWDTAGEERFRTITSSYYRGSHGILVVFDLTNRNSYMNVKYWLKEVMRYCDKSKVTIRLIGNKADLLQLRVISYEEAKEFAQSVGLDYFETSARSSRESIEYCFLDIAADILNLTEPTPIAVNYEFQIEEEVLKIDEKEDNSARNIFLVVLLIIFVMSHPLLLILFVVCCWHYFTVPPVKAPPVASSGVLKNHDDVILDFRKKPDFMVEGLSNVLSSMTNITIDNYKSNSRMKCWKEGTSAMLYTGSYQKQCDDESAPIPIPVAIKLYKEAFIISMREESVSQYDAMQMESIVYRACTDCPYAVHILHSDVDPATTHPYIVTELFSAYGTLQSVLKLKHLQLTWGWKLTVLLQISLFLEYLHELKIVHTDLKAENCLVVSLFHSATDSIYTSTQANDCVVKVYDFNSSCYMGKLTKERIDEIRRTPSHTPPEFVNTVASSVNADEELLVLLDGKFDIYSFGILMAEVAAHGLFYDMSTVCELTSGGMMEVQTVLGRRPMLAQTTAAESLLPKGYKVLAENCWHEDPIVRPTAEEVTKTLREMLVSLN